MSYLDGQSVCCGNETRAVLPEEPLDLVPLPERRVRVGSEMDQGEPSGPALPGDGDRLLRVQVWPFRALLPGFQPALGDQEVCVPGKPHGVRTRAGVRAEGDLLPFDHDRVPEAGDRVDQRPALDRERDRVGPLREPDEPDRVGQVLERHREWLPDQGPERRLDPGLPADPERVPEPELDEGVEPGDVVEMVVADEQEHGQLLVKVAIGLRDTVPGVEDDAAGTGPDQHRAGVPGEGIVPPVGPEEGDVHGEDVGAGTAKRLGSSPVLERAGDP